MQERSITVKGTGRVSAAPDLIVITLRLETVMPEYAQAMACATAELEGLRNALHTAGHDKTALKTTDFSVGTKYEGYRDAKGNYKQRFEGYQCNHSLKLEFDFAMRRLGETLTALSACDAAPELQIAFSVKDQTAVAEALLESAVANAKATAAVLAKAAGVQLGAIRHIDYNWSELRLFSETKYATGIQQCEASVNSMEIAPEDVDVSDTVTVVWEIV
jgi:uncharacterized protein YggE